MGSFKEKLNIFTSGLSRWEETATFMPSQKFLTERLAIAAIRPGTKTVVEIGPGTGVTTQSLLKHLPLDGRCFAIEINPTFAEIMNKRIHDKRLKLIIADARQLSELLSVQGVGQVDAVVSSLGMSLLPDGLRQEILSAAHQALAPGGVFVQYVYLHTKVAAYSKDKGLYSFDLEPELRSKFHGVQRSLELRNAPPAWVFCCQK